MGNSFGGRGRGGRLPPHCQLCRTNGHYSSSYPSLHIYASTTVTTDANLAQDFTSQCHVNQGHLDWYVDSGPIAYMTPSPDNLSHTTPHSGNMCVTFGMVIFYLFHILVNLWSQINLHFVMFWLLQSSPKISYQLANLLWITQLMSYFLSLFSIFRTGKLNKQVKAQGLCEDGLYFLRDTPMALTATSGVSKKPYFELWHNHFGHVSFDVIKSLHELGVLRVTSILPKPVICKPCQLSKGQ